MTTFWRARAESRLVPNGFSMMMRDQPRCWSFGPSSAAASCSTIFANTDGGVDK